MSNVHFVSQCADLPTLHRDLHSAKASISEAARAKLDRISADQLLTLLRMEVQRGKLKGAGKATLWLMAQAGILAVIVLVLALFAALTTGDFLTGCSAVGNPFCDPPDIESSTEQLRQIARALARSPDPRATGALLEGVALNSFLAVWFGTVLDERLAVVTRPDAARWAPAHLRLLARWLDTAVRAKAGRTRLLAILSAVDEAGVAEAMPGVLLLTKHGDPQIRLCAEQCRSGLRRSAEASRQSGELLRAGARPGSSPAELLRAGTTLASTDPASLLRPDDGAHLP